MTDLLDFELEEYMNEEEDAKEAQLEKDKAALKDTLMPIVKSLRAAQLIKSDTEAAFTLAKAAVTELEGKIRSVWGPYTEGVDKASIDIDGSRLESAVVLNVKTCGEGHIDWLREHGYEDVMKYQIHHMTLSKIARDLYADGTEIPDLQYTKFTKIKLK